MKFKWASILLIATLLVCDASFAQWSRRGGDDELPLDRSDYPTWENDPAFPSDIFTFVRIQYDSRGGFGRGRGGSTWSNDHPQSEWNFSLRLHQMTSMKVDPNGKVLRLTDPELMDYPFIYMNGVGGMQLREEEVGRLRHYLTNGGFLMLDDFWGDRELQVVTEQLARAVPKWKPRRLPMNHEIFHAVYNLKEPPQVPGLRHWRTGRTFEDHGPGSEIGPNFQGIFDDEGHLVVLLCHNNDLGDGWEREGENVDYFNECAVKHSYPMGINIITYVMTH